jgi:PAS domain S-box-containing protein
MNAVAESTAPATDRNPPPATRRWELAVGGLIVALLSHVLLSQLSSTTLVFAPLGFGLALVAWHGYGLAVGLALGLIVLQWVFPPAGTTAGQAVVEGVFTGVNIAAAWWCYMRAGGARMLNDPRSATVFLLLVPGLVTLACAAPIALAGGGETELWRRVLYLWLDRAVSILALSPPLLIALTPWLVRYRFSERAPEEPRYQLHPRLTWTLGQVLETVGLSCGAAVVALALAALHARDQATTWHLWAILLLVIVWASLRLGLRGGTLVAAAATVPALVVGGFLATSEASMIALRGNLLAQCTTALLIGASADWIRASEARYRQIVGHIPVVLYSARFLRKPTAGALPDVEILLVSTAAQTILGRDPDSLTGDFRAWMECIHPADRELLRAALLQLLLQKQPVKCEYRLAEEGPAANRKLSGRQETINLLANVPRAFSNSARYVRDTLAPHYDADGQLDGWEGVVEDITEQRQLAHDLRRTGNMLQALIAHLPMGVFFVQGPHGQPLLVNARARQLLGQREDMAAGLSHLADVYRLHRPDGKPYPWEELPVCKSLREGSTNMCDDIVVHRPDGRHVPLVTWAAPVDLGGLGARDAAVWVLEDLTALRQAEAARSESELRLQVVIETMAEGLIVQNAAGAIVECNPAACAIVGVDAETLHGWTSLAADGNCLREDGCVLPRAEQPGQVCLATGQPVRNVVMGLATPSGLRWILANCMLISPKGHTDDARWRRVVTTFVDITAQRQAAEVLRHSEERYRGLVESLPLMLLQFDLQGVPTYHNRAAEQLTGFPAEALAQHDFWRRQVNSDDAAGFAAFLDAALAGHTHRGEFRFQTAQGGELVGYATAQPLPGGGATVLVVDMTQRRRLEQEMQKVQRMELVGRIASGVVHDFNNLLTVIMGYASLAQKAVKEEAVRDDLDRILQATDQARLLASQLLAFSKQRQVVMKPTDLSASAKQAVELLMPTLPDTLDVHINTSHDPLSVQADDGPLQQVVINLCLNARDAMPNGGQLTVETVAELLQAGDLIVAGAANNGIRRWARLRVADTGSGMDETVKARLFEPLFTTKERGSGLGLAVVKQIVEGFGGCIRVESQPGHGSRFDVWLPAI